MLESCCKSFGICMYVHVFPLTNCGYEYCSEYQTYGIQICMKRIFITINIQSTFDEKFPDGWLRMSEGEY